MKDNILNNEISERLKTLNQWALSVFQRLEREHPEVLEALLNTNKEVQLDQRRKNKTSKRTSGEIQKSSS
jgi:hypothetical protein